MSKADYALEKVKVNQKIRHGEEKSKFKTKLLAIRKVGRKIHNKLFALGGLNNIQPQLLNRFRIFDICKFSGESAKAELRLSVPRNDREYCHCDRNIA